MARRPSVPDLSEVLATHHETAEHVSEDGPLVVGQRVREDHDADPALPAGLGDFAGPTGAEQRSPRERVAHLVRAAGRDTPPLHVPAHDLATVGFHQAGEQIELAVELPVLRREQAHQRHPGACQHSFQRPAPMSVRRVAGRQLRRARSTPVSIGSVNSPCAVSGRLPRKERIRPRASSRSSSGMTSIPARVASVATSESAVRR